MGLEHIIICYIRKTGNAFLYFFVLFLLDRF
jgi:hypothetical protein